MKLGLSLVNPTLAIKAIVQILLGQPAGQASLFQRSVCEGLETRRGSTEALSFHTASSALCATEGSRLRNGWSTPSARRSTTSRSATPSNNTSTLASLSGPRRALLPVGLLRRLAEVASRRAGSLTALSTPEADEDMIISIVRQHGSQHELKLVTSWHAAFVKSEASASVGPIDDESPAGRFTNLKDLLA